MKLQKHVELAVFDQEAAAQPDSLRDARAHFDLLLKHVTSDISSSSLEAEKLLVMSA